MNILEINNDITQEVTLPFIANTTADGKLIAIVNTEGLPTEMFNTGCGAKSDFAVAILKIK